MPTCPLCKGEHTYADCDVRTLHDLADLAWESLKPADWYQRWQLEKQELAPGSSQINLKPRMGYDKRGYRIEEDYRL